MKRPHSSDDLDSHDRDRSHRRFYTTAKPKSDDDEVRDLRPPRKRFDHDSSEAFRRSSFPDRDHPDPFLARRDFPKGFRSERDRPRRNGGGGWRRPGELRDLGYDQRQQRSQESPGESRKLKADRDVEEGELEPDSVPKANARNEGMDGSGEENEMVVSDSKKVADVLKIEAEEPVADLEEVVEERAGDGEEKQPVKLMCPVIALEMEGENVNAEDRGDSGHAPWAEKESVKDVLSVVADGEVEENVAVVREEVVERIAQTGEGGRGMVGAKVDEGKDLGEEKEPLTLGLLKNESGRDKGKAPAGSTSDDGNSSEDDDEMEGVDNRGFELVFQSEAAKTENQNAGAIVIGKSKDDQTKVESLDLSLGLPGISSISPFHKTNPKPSSPQRTKSFQSFASSFQTNSEDFTMSISLSGSQTFVHNPSCSLQQNSMENYEQPVHSRPIFQPVEQNLSGTIWQAQLSNELKKKGETIPLHQRVILNGKMSHHSGNPTTEPPYSKSDDIGHQLNMPRCLQQPTQSQGSQDTRSEHIKENKVLKRDRGSSSLFKSEQREKEQVLNRDGFEKILAMVVSEPVQLISRRIHEMTEQCVLCLKGVVSEMLVNKDKHMELLKLQEVLSRRSDFSLETLSKSHQVVLEILVAMKTGLPDFLVSMNNASASDLAEIFINMKCRNLACRSSIPVDECDCKCCSKEGFCSSCMCLLCSKFDLASNTCSWVGCDVCLHWCHTDCGLRKSYIRNGRSTTGAPDTTEMLFYCIACEHTSEMFGFVKDVFVTCEKDWNAETLAKELEYVRRIFSASADSRGKMLQLMVVKLLQKLENKLNLPEVFNSIMGFLTGNGSKPDSKLSVPLSDVPKKATKENNMQYAGVNGAVSGGNCVFSSPKEPLRQSWTPREKLSEKLAWHPSFSTKRSPRTEVSAGAILTLDHDRFKSALPEISFSALPNFDGDKLGRRTTMDSELPGSLEKKHVLDELDNLVKFKTEEAKIYQSRADEARREAEGLKRIAAAKSEKIDDEYSNKIAKLRIYEAEERQRQKSEELQALECAQCEYFSMKIRMEVDIKNLLLRMDSLKHKLGT